MNTRTEQQRLLPTAVLAVVVWSLGPGNSLAWDWAKEMFDHTTHDFGVVARGAKVEHSFTVENKYEEDAHIAAVRSTCPCTSGKIDKPFLKTWEKARITVTVDTRGFVGRKDGTIAVVFDKPFPAEVQLHVHTYIRSDVVVQPAAVQFGSVALGSSAQQKVSVSYAGRSDWRIERVESDRSYLAGKVAETSRSSGRVNYDLLVTLQADAPAGYLQEHVFLITNDFNAQSARVPVAVEGVVTAATSVRPSPLMLGLVEVGQPVTRQLVVQGKTPFRVTSVRCDNPRFKATPPEGAKTLHLIPVTFTADALPGKYSGTIRIDTDQTGAAGLEVAVHVQVVPRASDAQEK
jgi:hypothetical protein